MWAKVGWAAALIAVHALVYEGSGIHGFLSAIVITASYAALIHARYSKPSRMQTIGMYAPAISILIVMAPWTYRNFQNERPSAGILVLLLVYFTASLMGRPLNLFEDKKKSTNEKPLPGEQV